MSEDRVVASWMRRAWLREQLLGITVGLLAGAVVLLLFAALWVLR